MEKIFFILFISLAVSSVSFGQKLEVKSQVDSTNVDTVSLGQILEAKEHADSVYVDSAYVDTIYRSNDEIIEAFIGVNTTYSLINQSNSYFALNQGGFGKHFGLETSLLNLSIIKCNGFRYYSSNSIPAICMLIPMSIYHGLTGNDPSILFLNVPAMIIGIPMVVIAATNFKIGYQLNNNVKLLMGIRTDYYYFYPDTRTSRQLLTGARFTFKKFNIDVFYNYPWARGFINSEKSFLSVGVTYDALKEADAKSEKKSKKSKVISRLLH